jgi:hypothetical protein
MRPGGKHKVAPLKKKFSVSDLSCTSKLRDSKNRIAASNQQ